jgi:hypothetical protein
MRLGIPLNRINIYLLKYDRITVIQEQERNILCIVEEKHFKILLSK